MTMQLSETYKARKDPPTNALRKSTAGRCSAANAQVAFDLGFDGS